MRATGIYSKQKNKSPETNVNEMEISELPNRVQNNCCNAR